jgi:hypothetical protein
MEDIVVNDDSVNCPTCDEVMTRLRRKGLMRLFINAQHVYCRSCHERYLTLAGLYIRLKPVTIIL